MSRRIWMLASVAVAVLAPACSVQRLQPAKSAQMSQMPMIDDHMSHMSAADLRAPVARSSASDNQQGTPGLPPSNNQAEARIKATPRHAEWVKIAWEPGSADSLMAWVVYPKSTGKAPVVVVVHEIFGLSTWVRGVADQVAADGFIAIAPDFLSRVRGGPSTEELSGTAARGLIGGVAIPERNKAIVASANYAMMLPSAQQKYAVIGYCWGGQTVWGHAVSGGVKGFSGGVAYYGAFPYTSGGSPASATTAAVPSKPTVDSLLKINKPVMLLSGTGDARIGATMPGIDSLMKANKKDYLGMNYEGAIHGFLRAQDDAIAPSTNPNAPARDAASISAEQAANLAATKDAWPKTIAFLKKNLGVK